MFLLDLQDALILNVYSLFYFEYIYYKYFYLFFNTFSFYLLLFIYIIELKRECALQDNFVSLK